MGMLTPLLDFLAPLAPTIGIPESAFQGARAGLAAVDKKYIRPNTDELLTGGTKYLGQQQTNAANAQQAQKQMDFQASQTGSAYQRAVKDMEAAGLNPMLAYSQGGASSAGGAQAQLGNKVGEGVSGAMQAATLIADINNKSADTHLKDTSAKINEGTPALQKSQTDLAIAQALREASQTRLSDATAKQVDQQVRNLLADLEYTNLRNRQMKGTIPYTVKEAAATAEGKSWEAARSKTAYRLEEGTRTTRTESATQNLEQQRLNYLIDYLGLPAETNRSRYSKTWLGENISPALRDVVGAGHAGHSAASIYNLTGK